MKSVWITATDKDQENVQKLVHMIGTYGLEANGSFWEDDLKKMAWLTLKEKLLSPAINLWLILCPESSLTEDVRYGLTLLKLSLEGERGDLPILLVDPVGTMTSESLPGVFSSSPLVSGITSTVGVKCASLANLTHKPAAQPYYLNLHANPGFGVWFEVGPADDEQWHGVLFGCEGGEIKAHGVGTRGELPEKCVLEYPVKGMTLEAGESVFNGWGVSNLLTPDNSYFVKLEGAARALLFGQMPQGEDADLHILR